MAMRDREDNESVVVTFQVAIRRSRVDGLWHEWARVVKECGGAMTTRVQPADSEQTRTSDFDRAQAPRLPGDRKPVTAQFILSRSGNEPKRR